MTRRTMDTGLGLFLLAVASNWIWLVSATIRTGFGGGDLGPRAFPLTFGIMLAMLSVLLLVRIYLSSQASEDAAPQGDTPHFTFWPAVIVLAEIVLYGFLMQKMGFLIATTVIVLLVMLFTLRLRSIKTILGMSFGVPVGSWLLFEKLLGIYLANGTWINVG